MLDVESLGNEGNFVVLQVSLVLFDKNEIGDTFSVNIDLNDSINKGFKTDKATVKWWTEQNPQVFASMFKNAISIEKAVGQMRNFIQQYDIKRFWASATLDYQAISNLSNSVNTKNPIAYDKRFCTRTIRMLHDSLYIPFELENSHDSIEDCINQIRVLRRHFENLEYEFL